MLSKVRHYVQNNELRNIYHCIFESHPRCGCQIWFLSSSKFVKDKIEKLQKKALRTMSFSDLRDSSSLLLKKWKILKIKDIVDLQNCLLCHAFLNGKLPTSFETFFQRCSDIHNAPTRFSNVPRFKSVKYGLNSITNACIQSWNKTPQILESPSSLALSEVKQEMSNHYMNNY